MHMIDQDKPWEGLLKRKECPAGKEGVESDDAEDATKSSGSASSSPQQKVAPVAGAGSRIVRQDSFKSSIFKNLSGSGKAVSPTQNTADA
eukprot:6255395-Amphidinium_carterae.6